MRSFKNNILKIKRIKKKKWFFSTSQNRKLTRSNFENNDFKIK